MAVTTAKRLNARTIELRGPALDTVLQIAASPYDLHHPHHQASSEIFLPAREYVKTLGYLTRAYLDSKGWVRDAAFEIGISALLVESDSPGALDALEQLITRLNPQAASPTYMFHYQHTDDDGLPVFDPDTLIAVNSRQIAEMIENDTSSSGRGIFARRKPSIDIAFGTYIAGRIDAQLVVREVRYDIDLLGFSYDTAALEHLHQRSGDELADLSAQMRPQGFLSLVSGSSRVALTPFTPLRSVSEPASARSNPPSDLLELPSEGWTVEGELPPRYTTLNLDRETLLDELEEDSPESEPRYDEIEPPINSSPPAIRPKVFAPDKAGGEVDDFLDGLLSLDNSAVPLDDAKAHPPAGQSATKDYDQSDDPLSFLDEPEDR